MNERQPYKQHHDWHGNTKQGWTGLETRCRPSGDPWVLYHLLSLVSLIPPSFIVVSVLNSRQQPPWLNIHSILHVLPKVPPSIFCPYLFKGERTWILSDFCIVKTFFVDFFARVLLPGYVSRVHATSLRGSGGGSQVWRLDQSRTWPDA